MHTWCLATEDHFETSTKDMDRASPESSDSASSSEDVLVGFRSSSKCSVYHLTISSVWVSSSPPRLNIASAKPCFPFLSWRTVCSSFLEANRKSFSIASPNSSRGSLLYNGGFEHGSLGLHDPNHPQDKIRSNFIDPDGNYCARGCITIE